MEEPKQKTYFKIIKGVDRNGQVLVVRLNGYHKRTLDLVYNRVYGKDWDYVAIVAGIPGVGKSEFAKVSSRYLCPWFDEKYIAFNAQDFIRITTEAPEYSAVVLDESFESLNTSMSRSPQFVKIINHLQLIRKKHLFIFLCLPNFFDLGSGIALFRSSHLFVVEADEEGNRGYFKAYGRRRKWRLYVNGKKFMNYKAEKPNYKDRFYKHPNIIPEHIYDALKEKNIRSHIVEIEKKNKWEERFIKLVTSLVLNKKLTRAEIGRLSGIDGDTVGLIVKNATKNADNRDPNTYKETDKR